MLVSSYLDEAISGTLDNFIKNNPEIFTQKGELKAQYKNIENIYNEINTKRNAKFKKYLNGEHQVIMVGEIAGVPVKIKTDSFYSDKCIVDLKCVKDLNLIYNEKTKQKENFVNYYSYDIQRCNLSRDSFSKYRKTIAIYYCSLYQRKISTICFIANSARKT